MDSGCFNFHCSILGRQRFANFVEGVLFFFCSARATDGFSDGVFIHMIPMFLITAGSRSFIERVDTWGASEQDML